VFALLDTAHNMNEKTGDGGILLEPENVGMCTRDIN
jgi:hypothetical protein